MYRTVLVPLDGSELSERAVPFGRILADAGRAPLILIRVVPPDLLGTRLPSEQEKAMADASDYVSGFVVKSEGGSSVDSIVYAGDPASLIVDEAQARPSSLIVMSSHGRSGVSELFSGSVTEEVIRRAERPVLVIPPDCKGPWSAEQRGRVLVTLDGSALSEGILPDALDIAQALRQDLTLMRVIAVTEYIRVEGYPDPVAVPSEGISDGEAEVYLNDLAHKVGTAGHLPTTLVTEGLDAASAILLAAKDQGATLIAMATHGRGGLPELVLGSVANAVVKQATVPVLLTRPSNLRHATSEELSSETSTR